MQIIEFLISLSGAVLLLLYAIRMVKTGMERAYGRRLQQILSNTNRNIARAIFTGTLASIALQSSAAVNVLVANFTTTNTIALISAIAISLGADLGSALVVRFLVLDLSILIPLALCVGVGVFFRSRTQKTKQFGRILIGIALVLISIRFMGQATSPLRNSEILPLFVQYLDQDLLIPFLLAIAFSVLIHSSIAAILMIIAFLSQNLIPLDTAIALLLGANIGSGLIPLWIMRNEPLHALRAPLGNFLFRLIGALGVFCIHLIFPLPMDWLGDTHATQVINLHIAFNLALIIIGGLCLQPMTGLVNWIDRQWRQESNADWQEKSALEDCDLQTPSLALANAKRELLRMGGMIEATADQLRNQLEQYDEKTLADIRERDHKINEAYTDIKLYITALNNAKPDELRAQEGMALCHIAINMEHAGDILFILMPKLLRDMHKQGVGFSPEGYRDLELMHNNIMTNMRLALSLLTTYDHTIADELLEAKRQVNKMERDLLQRHMQRLQKGNAKSIASSNFHLEVLHNFKEVNSLFAMLAYYVLAHHQGYNLINDDGTIFDSPTDQT